MRFATKPRPLPRVAGFVFWEWLLCALLCAAGEARAEIVPGVVVVGFDGAPAAREFARGRAASLGLGSGRLIRKLGIQTLTVPVGQERAWADRLRLEPGVRFAEPEAAFHAARVPDDSLYSSNQAIYYHSNSFYEQESSTQGINLEDAWNYRTGAGDIILAILDSGIDFAHPDLRTNIFHRPYRHPQSRDNPGDEFTDDTLGWNFIANNDDPRDDAGHGTAVAGMLGAVGNNGIGISGVLWKTQMLAVKVLDSGLNGTGSGIAAGVIYSVDAGARIINLSLSGDDFSTPLYEAIRFARDHRVIVVCAAGNNGRDIRFTPAYPASFDLDNIVAVAAVDALTGGRTSTTNFGGPIHVAAPGGGVITTLLGGSYGTESGTSFAAPIVTGAVAMLWDRWQDWTYPQVIGALYAGVNRTRGDVGGFRSVDFREIVQQFLGDSFPPAALRDLKLVPVGGGTAWAIFTASGEDGGLGRAESYLLRWSVNPIAAATFDSASVIENTKKPSFSGVRDSILVSGLPFDRAVHVAMKVRDRVHNLSPVSNDATIVIGSPATIRLDPEVLFLSVLQGDGGSGRFRIHNRGNEPLEGQLLQISDPHFGWQTSKSGVVFHIAPHDSLQATVSVDASDLSAGAHFQLPGYIDSNDPRTPRIHLAIDLLVTAGSAPGDSSGRRISLPRVHDPRAGAEDSYAARSLGGEGSGQRFALGPAWFESGAAPRILDVTGREVARLARPATIAGPVTWDGITMAGVHAASGIYFLQLQAPGRSRVLRFVRIR